MANFEHLIPYILFMEEGLKQSDILDCCAAQLYAKAAARGVHTDPADAGGATLCGVTLATYRTYKRGATARDLGRMTYAVWRDILKRLYWDRWHADEIRDQSVANMLVDWVWGSGKYGIIVPQRLLGVKADGAVGPVTLAAVNAAEQRDLFERLKAERHRYHQSCINKSVAAYARKIGREPTLTEKTKYTNYRYRHGWARRVNGIVYGGFDYEV